MNNDIEIGKRIKEFALNEFESLSDFCKEMGVKMPYVYPYINGTSLPGTNFLVKMLKLGCDINWLLSGVESSEKIQLGKIYQIMEEGSKNRKKLKL